jgi:hypothetical protein
MTNLVTTRDASRILGVPVYALYWLLRCDRIPPPPKTTTGDYDWQPEDLERARAALARRRRRAQGEAVA